MQQKKNDYVKAQFCLGLQGIYSVILFFELDIYSVILNSHSFFFELGKIQDVTVR